MNTYKTFTKGASLENCTLKIFILFIIVESSDGCSSVLQPNFVLLTECFQIKRLAQCSVRNERGQLDLICTMETQTQEEKERQRRQRSCSVCSKASWKLHRQQPVNAQIIMINTLTLSQMNTDNLSVYLLAFFYQLITRKKVVK